MTAPRISFTWSTRRDGNSGYVKETVTGPDPYEREFGPMPAHIVPAFVAARRRLVAFQAQLHGALYVSEALPDYSYLTDTPKPR